MSTCNWVIVVGVHVLSIMIQKENVSRVIVVGVHVHLNGKVYWGCANSLESISSSNRMCSSTFKGIFYT